VFFLEQLRKDDDVDGVDGGTATVIDGELEVLFVKMFISCYSVVHRVNYVAWLLCKMAPTCT